MTKETVALLFCLDYLCHGDSFLLWTKCALFSDYKNEDSYQSQDAKIN